MVTFFFDTSPCGWCTWYTAVVSLTYLTEFLLNHNGYLLMVFSMPVPSHLTSIKPIILLLKRWPLILYTRYRIRVVYATTWYYVGPYLSEPTMGPKTMYSPTFTRYIWFWLLYMFPRIRHIPGRPLRDLHFPYLLLRVLIPGTRSMKDCELEK